MFKNALISVSDKSGLIEFVKPLQEKGMRILSTGGTAKHLKSAGIDVIQVSDQTGFPEVMGGRVKTLHPKIHMALLARAGNSEDEKVLSEFDIEPIDLVVGNLYPFEEAQKTKTEYDELVEYVDIGGPSFLRASAKNYSRIAVVCDPRDYNYILEKQELTEEDRRLLAAKVFYHTSQYDALIAKTFQGAGNPQIAFGGHHHKALRYGENPQQKSAWYRSPEGKDGIHNATVLQGKELSFNNILDIEAATRTLRSFGDEFVAVSVKHNNPCGVGQGDDIETALARSLEADPVSVFGGIVALSHPVNFKCAEKLSSLFLECVVAPGFDSEAMELMAKKKNLRLLQWKSMGRHDDLADVRQVNGGFLVQDTDEVGEWSDDWKIIGENPDEETRKGLLFSWKVCSHLKSNAIAITSGNQSLGLGMGQVNRVDAVEQALLRVKKNHGSRDGMKYLASDAFFPFPDSLELAFQAGIKWVIQPGGSIKDEEVITYCEQNGINMVLTGRRHFRH